MRQRAPKNVEIVGTPMKINMRHDITHWNNPRITIDLKGLANPHIDAPRPGPGTTRYTGPENDDPRYAAAAEHLMNELQKAVVDSKLLRMLDPPRTPPQLELTRTFGYRTLHIQYPNDDKIWQWDKKNSGKLFDLLAAKMDEIVVSKEFLKILDRNKNNPVPDPNATTLEGMQFRGRLLRAEDEARQDVAEKAKKPPPRSP